MILSLLSGCSRSQPAPFKKFSKQGDFFGSVIKIDVCYTDQQAEALNAAIDSIWARFADIHWRLSVYDPESDLNRINNSSGPVTIGADTYGLIADSVYYHKISDGMFDITILPLIKLWKNSEKKNTLPAAEEIRQAQAVMGMDKFKLLERNQVARLNPGTKLTIDSIADGYAADEAARVLRGHGFSNFLVDASGELYAGGKSCEGKKWRIGVQNPQKHGALIDVLEIESTSVTTSGNYEHFYTIAGQQYSHIIDPKTGWPKDEILSATVVAPSAEFSDFWSTALSLLSPERGAGIIDGLGEGYASMVIVKGKDGTVSRKESRNYKKFLMRKH